MQKSPESRKHFRAFCYSVFSDTGIFCIGGFVALVLCDLVLFIVTGCSISHVCG